MKNIKEFTKKFTAEILRQFQDNVVAVGLQGSYGRGEADKNSDVDIVCILQKCSFKEIILYKEIIAEFSKEYKMCGFLSGKEELVSWSAGDLFQLYMDTDLLYGSLDFLKDKFNKQAVKELIKINSCNLYHGCVHNYLYDHQEDLLREFFKMAVFVVKAKYYYHYQQYISKHQTLLELLPDGDDRQAVQYYYKLKVKHIIDEKNFYELSEFLYNWSRTNILQY